MHTVSIQSLFALLVASFSTSCQHGCIDTAMWTMDSCLPAVWWFPNQQNKIYREISFQIYMNSLLQSIFIAIVCRCFCLFCSHIITSIPCFCGHFPCFTCSLAVPGRPVSTTLSFQICSVLLDTLQWWDWTRLPRQQDWNVNWVSAHALYPINSCICVTKTTPFS